MTTTPTRPAFPAWINVDAIASPQEFERIEQAQLRMRDFVKEAIEMARECRWAFHLTARLEDADLDDVDILFQEVAGTGELHDLARMLGYLFAPGSSSDDDFRENADKWNGAVHGLRDAVDEIDFEQNQTLAEMSERGQVSE